MCGIAGEVSYDAPLDRARVARITGALAHRGPDGEGILLAGAACLGHRRLALLDRAGGAQPFRSPDGRYALVFNGEIDNAAALRDRYADRWRFRTRSDTEVLLVALIFDGERAIPSLDGMFAFFFWDEQEQRGLAARDRLGVRPFVYAITDRFTFASEAKALVRAGVLRPSIDRLAIAEYLCAAPFSGVERAPFEGIEILPPGGLLRVDRDGVHRRRYFRAHPTATRRDRDELAPALRSALERAVAGSLVSDEPIGIFLSGGLDSTLIAALARRSLPAFTVGFAGQADFDWASSRIVISDDEPYAAEAAAALGLPRQRCLVPSSIARIAVNDDLLPAWEQELSQDVLSLHAARTVKAVLVGDAADETHYGYHFLLDEDALSGPERILPRFGVAPLRRDLIGDPIAYFASIYRDRAAAAGYGWGSLEERRLATTHLILHRWLPRLLSNGDLHAMAHGLEARVPFASPALVELALSIDPALALAGGVEKSLLREVARGLVPDSIVRRRKSALPKDLTADYRPELIQALQRRRDVLAAVLDLDAVDALMKRAWTEADRAVAFRIIALSHWAACYEVAV